MTAIKDAPPRDSLPLGHDFAFKDILRHLVEEEYERASAAAGSFLKWHANTPFEPYARYFLLFARGHRAWESSYRYTRIRSHFMLAQHLLNEGVERTFGGEVPGDHARVLNALEHLTRMVCAFTHCENAIITNDSFALAEHSHACIDEERQGAALLEGFHTDDARLKAIADWLHASFLDNLHLHEGLNACARIYCSVLRRKPEVESVFRQYMPVAARCLEELRKESPRLSAELNAHILHTCSHFRRVTSKEEPVSYLRVAGGKLVVALSAGCNREVARSVIKDQSHWSAIELAFQAAQLRIENCRRGQVSDAFVATTGRSNLETVIFELADTVPVTFLGGRRYEWDVHFTINALGCTVFFTLPIAHEGLTVEEVRALQALICPFSGQVKVHDDPDPEAPIRVHHFNFSSRLSLGDLVRDLREVRAYIESQPLGEAELGALQHAYATVDAAACEAIDDLVTDAGDGLDADSKITAAMIGALVAELQRVATQAGQPDEPHRLIGLLLADTNRYQCLTDVAYEYLHVVETAFRNIGDAAGCLPPTPADADPADDARRVWNLSLDTGWYTYLSAASIDDMKWTGELKRRQVTFNQITRHPDALGFVIEQREARASFDDWRFTGLTEVPQEQNLAQIRSHATDAFFCSEYQAFLYFPDDPQYLVDQYETTVELMIRTNTALRFFTMLTLLLGRSIRRRLSKVDREAEELAVQGVSAADVTSDEEALKRDLSAIRALRGEAEELRTLILRTGISRYKDHGDLLKRIVSRMNMEQSMGLLEQQLQGLDQLHEQIQEHLQDLKDELTARNQRFWKRLAVIATAFASAIPARAAVGEAFRIDGVRTLLKAWGIGLEAAEFAVTLLVVALVTIVLVVKGWPRDQERRRREPAEAPPSSAERG